MWLQRMFLSLVLVWTNSPILELILIETKALFLAPLMSCGKGIPWSYSAVLSTTKWKSQSWPPSPTADHWDYALVPWWQLTPVPCSGWTYSSCGTCIWAPRPNFSFPLSPVDLTFYLSRYYKWLILENHDTIGAQVYHHEGLSCPVNICWVNEQMSSMDMTGSPILQKENGGSVLAKMTSALSCTVRMQTQISDPGLRWDL